MNDLDDLEWRYRPTVMGELIARLFGARAVYQLAEEARANGQPEAARLCEAIAAREEYYLRRKAEKECAT